MKFEVGIHDGAFQAKLHSHVPFIGRKTLTVRQKTYNDIHGCYRGQVEHLFAGLWSWRVVCDIWLGSYEYFVSFCNVHVCFSRGGWMSGWSGKIELLFGAVYALCVCCAETPPPRAVLNGKKKSVPEPVFPKKPAGTPCAQPWLVAVGGWRLAALGSWQLATGGWWRLVVVGGGWWLVIGGRWRLAVVGSWWLVATGGWRRLMVGGWSRLAVDGSWRLAVPWGGP